MQPVIFVSHGAPTLLIDGSPTQAFLRRLGKEILASNPKPEAILCVSAHCDAKVHMVTASPRPELIYDFFGFPDELYDFKYPTPGAPGLAQTVADTISAHGIDCRTHPNRGLDHGAWVPLSLMFPDASIPVLQLSIDSHQSAEHHYKLGQALRELRQRNILIVASGGATHNLGEFRGQALDAPPPAHVKAFAKWLTDCVTRGATEELLAYRTMAPEPHRIHPTPEHYLPLPVALGAATKPEGTVLLDSFAHSILSMAAFRWE